jgi:hypothetical protein
LFGLCSYNISKQELEVPSQQWCTENSNTASWKSSTWYSFRQHLEWNPTWRGAKSSFLIQTPECWHACIAPRMYYIVNGMPRIGYAWCSKWRGCKTDRSWKAIWRWEPFANRNEFMKESQFRRSILFVCWNRHFEPIMSTVGY